MKRRWRDTTVASGLHRDSAAWFVVAPGVAPDELARTLAAAIYLALARATRADLDALAGAGTYEDYFRANPELLPSLLLFDDVLTGREVFHRYLWTGPPAPGTTAPYTKVIRAGRHASLHDACPEVVDVDAVMVSRAEAGAHAVAGQTGATPELIVRVPADAPAFDTRPAGPQTKLGAVCARLAATLRIVMTDRLERIEA